MSGVIAWLTGFLVGNDDGKQICAATIYRGYMYQAGMCAGMGVGSGYAGDGVDYSLRDDRPYFALRDDRPHYSIGE